jgi:hypothetical protein
MNLYLDDDSVRGLLIRLLVNGGHDVVQPADVGLAGGADAVHLRYAIQSGRVLLTHNHRDFADLHELVMEAGGRHPGIMVVRRDNHPSKDLSPKGIVRAVQKSVQSGAPIPDRLHILNQWR